MRLRMARCCRAYTRFSFSRSRRLSNRRVSQRIDLAYFSIALADFSHKGSNLCLSEIEENVRRTAPLWLPFANRGGAGAESIVCNVPDENIDDMAIS